MSPRPDVYLFSAASDSEISQYRLKAEKLKAAGLIDKADQDKCLELYSAQAGKKIALIDDDSVNLELSTELLTDYGAEVHSFSDPLEAMKQIQELKIDTVLSDVEMPEMDGFAVLTAINAMIFD